CAPGRSERMADSRLASHAFRLSPGEDLKAAIVSAVERRHAGAACILTTVGSLSRARLRYAGVSDYDEIVGDLEIVSLVGTIGPDGAHLHIAVADSTGRTIAGHMGDGCMVRTTAEVVVGVLPDVTFRRAEDPQTGYRELVVEPTPGD
ncbi:MAG: DNA-binding protein, partial [Phycisphaerales bacterium]|nr:DNA-binding protein [Phycisphaerales bacterium]